MGKKIELKPGDAKLLKDHKWDCQAVKTCKDGKWETPWTFAGAGTVNSDDEGFVDPTVRCNDPDCPAKARIRHEVLFTIMEACGINVTEYRQKGENAE